MKVTNVVMTMDGEKKSSSIAKYKKEEEKRLRAMFVKQKYHPDLIDAKVNDMLSVMT